MRGLDSGIEAGLSRSIRENSALSLTPVRTEDGTNAALQSDLLIVFADLGFTIVSDSKA